MNWIFLFGCNFNSFCFWFVNLKDLELECLRSLTLIGMFGIVTLIFLGCECLRIGIDCEFIYA